MGLYKYIVKQASVFNEEADNRAVIDRMVVVSHDVETSWGSATHNVAGSEEYNARVIGETLDITLPLKINAGKFTISNGVNTATITLTGTETTLDDIMKLIDQAFIDASPAALNMRVKSIIETNDVASTIIAYLEIQSTGTPGTSDQITIATTTATFIELGLTAATTNGTKPDVTVVDKTYLGGMVSTNEEIDNPSILKIEYIEMRDTGVEIGENREKVTVTIQEGYTQQEITDRDIPLTIIKTISEYVETVFDDTIDTPITDLMLDPTNLIHLYKCGNICVNYDTNKDICLETKYIAVETSQEERDLEAKYIVAFERKIDKETEELINEWCINNIGNEQKVMNLGIAKALGEILTSEEETMWSSYQTYKDNVVNSQRAKKIDAMVKTE